MDCHRCIHIRYDGSHYGRCSHWGHGDVVCSKGTGGARPYNRQICLDFVVRRRCSNCVNWERGAYFADGSTPSVKGRCMLGLCHRPDECPHWKQGRTSWRKRKNTSAALRGGQQERNDNET